MASFKILRGRSKDIPATIQNGFIYISLDNGKIYIDANNKRLLLNPTVFIESESIVYNGISIAMLLNNLLKSSAEVEINTNSYWRSYQ